MQARHLGCEVGFTKKEIKYLIDQFSIKKWQQE